MSRSLKIGAIVALLIFSSGALHTQATGKFFPGLPVSIVVSLIVLYAISSANRPHLVYSITAFATLGVLYRVFLYIFPVSMMRADPDAHAVRSQIIIQYGNLSGIVPDFYSKAPIFHILGSETAIITGLPVEDAYIVFPIVVGVSMSVFAAVLAKLATKDSRAAIAAAAIGAVSASTIKYAIGPIPMTLAAMYIAGCVLAIMLYRRSKGRDHLFIFVLFLIVAALTHKIPILIMVMLLGIFVVYSWLYSNAGGESKLVESLSLLMIGTVLLFFQWMYLAGFTGTAVRLISESILATRSPTETMLVDPAAALFINPPVFIKLRNLAYFFVSVGIGAVVGVHLFRHSDNRNVRILQSAALATVAITLPSLLLNTPPGFKRVFVYGSIFVAALIAVGVRHLSISSLPRAKTLSAALVILLLILNPLSVVATPDFPGTHRTYFTQQEVDGKHFMNNKAPQEVYLDRYYADEVFNFSRAADVGERHQRTVPNVEKYPMMMSRELTEGTLLEQNYTYIGLRTGVEIYRLEGGRYKLTWSPEQELNQTYSRTYTNGGSVLFSNE